MSRRYQSAILTASYNGLQVPNAPTIGTATAGSGSASVTFTAPSNVGGGAITSYTVISSPGSILGTGASSPVTVSGLTNGTAYTFTVVATNAYGSGPASAASNSVTPAVNYIEDVFSTYLYTGSSSAQTITNGIDLLNKGGLVWLKGRNVGSAYGYGDHELFDSANVGSTRKYLRSDGTDALGINGSIAATPFTASGFNLDAGPEINNNAGDTNVSWTFREQPKFFDVVTYTGDGTSGRTVAHNLGSVPGCMIVKKTNSTGQWCVYHRGLTTPATDAIFLNLTNAQTTDPNVWNSTAPTSTVFTLGNSTGVNNNGDTYVAYLFAHDAGGFGLTGTDNVISCGSYNRTDGVKSVVNLGFEPQFIIQKTATAASQWVMFDVMRGWTGASNSHLFANLSNAETTGNIGIMPTATGFEDYTTAGATDTIIYIAIRRGPMKVPTVGTSVFSPQTATYSANQVVTTGFPVDMTLIKGRTITFGTIAYDRLRGLASTNTSPVDPQLITSDTSAETSGDYVNTANNTGYQISAGFSGFSSVNWNFQRAPGFFDEVCYTGTGLANQTFAHNLAAVPELIIVKSRNNARPWPIYSKSFASGKYAFLNDIDPESGPNIGIWNYGTPTSTVFPVGAPNDIGGTIYPPINTNGSGYTYVAYLFATCAGVSKVGSYTGTGAAQTINCAFTTGARFVLIKRTDSTGDWYTYDSARGITSGNDPYLFLNSTAAEVTGTNYVDTTAVGFQVTAAAPAGLNAVGGTYIFLAIA